jgi:hypothetical protein
MFSLSRSTYTAIFSSPVWAIAITCRPSVNFFKNLLLWVAMFDGGWGPPLFWKNITYVSNLIAIYSKAFFWIFLNWLFCWFHPYVLMAAMMVGHAIQTIWKECICGLLSKFWLKTSGCHPTWPSLLQKIENYCQKTYFKIR